MHEDMIPGPPALRPVPDQPANIKIILITAPPPSITPIIHIFFTRINNNYLGICHRTFFRASLLVLSQLVREESPCNTSFIWLKPYICADQYGIFCFSGSQLPTRLSPPPSGTHPPKSTHQLRKIPFAVNAFFQHSLVPPLNCLPFVHFISIKMKEFGEFLMIHSFHTTV